MAKIGLTKLGLKINDAVNTFDFNGEKIEVKQYLPIKDKYDLIMIALQKCNEGGIYNPIKSNMYFSLNICYLYTNINFTDKQREDEEKLYDLLLSSGLMTQIIANIPEDEYETLVDLINETIEKYESKNLCVAGMINGLVEGLPAKMAEAKDVIESINPEAFQNVMAFTKAINNGQPL